MLKSLRLITTRRNGGRIVAGGPGQVADAEKKKSVFHSDSIDCNWVCTSESGRNGCKYNYWRRCGFTEQSEHWAVEVAMIRLGSQIGWAVPRECNTVHACSQMSSGLVNRGTAAIHRKYGSSDVNKSIAITIINWHVHRWFAAKLTFGQERRRIRSVASPVSQRWSH